MNLTKKMRIALAEESYSIEEAANMSRDEFIDTFKDSPNKSLRYACMKLQQYDNGHVHIVERNLLANIYDKDGKLTNHKRSFNIQLYRTFKIMQSIINKYYIDGNIFSLPIEYIAKCANTTNRTVKKAINTALKYNVIEFIGYSRKHSHFAVCQFKANDIELLDSWVEHGQKLYDVNFVESDILHILNENTKAKHKADSEKKVKKALKAMKACPMLIKIFNESNIYEDEFKQKFLLDGCLRALSYFTLTKNPDNYSDYTINYERQRLLKKLEADTGYKYVEADLPASIYSLSYYLKHGKPVDEYFYKYFAKKLKERYNNTTPYREEYKEKIKTFCMEIYMHGYSYKYKAIILANQYKNNFDLDYINDLIYYFSNKKISECDDYTEYYQEFYKNAYDVMCELCEIKRANIFLYESMLCSILIKLGMDKGITIVNAYDGFYMPEQFIEYFSNEMLPIAYQKTKEIYDIYKNKTIKEKNNELLEYLESIDKISIINNRKYVKIKDIYIDYYNYKILYETDIQTLNNTERRNVK